MVFAPNLQRSSLIQETISILSTKFITTRTCLSFMSLMWIVSYPFRNLLTFLSQRNYGRARNRSFFTRSVKNKIPPLRIQIVKTSSSWSFFNKSLQNKLISVANWQTLSWSDRQLRKRPNCEFWYLITFCVSGNIFWMYKKQFIVKYCSNYYNLPLNTKREQIFIKATQNLSSYVKLYIQIEIPHIYTIIPPKMSNKKNWREFNYIKAQHQQVQDSQSSISESRSSRSYHFNKVKFNKSRENMDKSASKFGLAIVARIKDSSRENSLVNESVMMKRVDSSANMHKAVGVLPATIRVPKTKRVTLHMQKFLTDAKHLHQSYKHLTDNLLLHLQKLKSQLQTNLLLIIDHLLQSDGNLIKQQQQIHQMIHKSFEQMRRNVVVLPRELTTRQQVDNERREEVLWRTDVGAKGERRQRHKGQTVLKEEQLSGEFGFELPISSSQKVRPSTQRKIIAQQPSSFNQKILPKQFISSPVQSRQKQHSKSDFFPIQKPSNLQDIINKMRTILDQ